MPHHQLVFELDGDQLERAEAVCNRLRAIALSLADAGDEPLLEPAPGETPVWKAIRLRALFDDAADPQELASALAGAIGLQRSAIGIERVEDRAWEREWLKDFRPMRFGRRLWVCPAGQRPNGPAPMVLELDPGLAFGTGTHATTAMCLGWLDGAISGGERPMMSFETLTLCPIDRRLIESVLLSPEELAWLNAYHARVEREVGAFLDGPELAWLKQACAPI